MKPKTGIFSVSPWPVRLWLGFTVLYCAVHTAPALAQNAPGPLTLNDAILLALKNYPALKERRASAVTLLTKLKAATFSEKVLETAWNLVPSADSMTTAEYLSFGDKSGSVSNTSEADTFEAETHFAVGTVSVNYRF